MSSVLFPSHTDKPLPYLFSSSLNSTSTTFISTRLTPLITMLIFWTSLSPRMAYYLKCVCMPPAYWLVLRSHLDLLFPCPSSLSDTLITSLSVLHKHYCICILDYLHLKSYYIILIPEEGLTRIQWVAIFCILKSLTSNLVTDKRNSIC